MHWHSQSLSRSVHTSIINEFLTPFWQSSKTIIKLLFHLITIILTKHFWTSSKYIHTLIDVLSIANAIHSLQAIILSNPSIIFPAISSGSECEHYLSLLFIIADCFNQCILDKQSQSITSCTDSFLQVTNLLIQSAKSSSIPFLWECVCVLTRPACADSTLSLISETCLSSQFYLLINKYKHQWLFKVSNYSNDCIQYHSISFNIIQSHLISFDLIQ